MKRKPQFKPHRCTKHLTEEQCRTLPKAIWDFLTIDRNFSIGEINGATTQRLNGWALAFIETEQGLGYWPMQKDQWLCDATPPETQKYVARIMQQECKLRMESDATPLIDYDPTEPANESNDEANARTSHSGVQARNKVTTTTTTSTTANPKPAGKSQKVSSASKATNSDQAAYVAKSTPSKKPLFPDIHHDASPEELGNKKRKPLKPTARSQHIAFETLRSPESADDSSTVIVTDAKQSFTGVDKFTGKVRPITPPSTPFRSRKRRTDEIDNESSTSMTLSPTERASKRAALDLRDLTVSNGSHSPTADGTARQSAIKQSRVLRPDTTSIEIEIDDQNKPNHATTPISTSTTPTAAAVMSTGPKEEQTPLVHAYGLQFKLEALIQIPQLLLDYVMECQDQNLRCAQEVSAAATHDNDDEVEDDVEIEAARKARRRRQQQHSYRARADFCNKLHADLESRVKVLAVDAVEKKRVERSYCLWNCSNL